MSTSPSSHTSNSTPPGLHTKNSHHPIAQLLLGRVVGVHLLGSDVILYYEDNHSALFHVDRDGDICIHDHEVPSC